MQGDGFPSPLVFHVRFTFSHNGNVSVSLREKLTKLKHFLRRSRSLFIFFNSRSHTDFHFRFQAMRIWNLKPLWLLKNNWRNFRKLFLNNNRKDPQQSEPTAKQTLNSKLSQTAKEFPHFTFQQCFAKPFPCFIITDAAVAPTLGTKDKTAHSVRRILPTLNFVFRESRQMPLPWHALTSFFTIMSPCLVLKCDNNRIWHKNVLKMQLCTICEISILPKQVLQTAQKSQLRLSRCAKKKSEKFQTLCGTESCRQSGPAAF